MSQQPEYTNFKERLQALARRKGGSGIVQIILHKVYTARILCVGADYVEFDELDGRGDRVATHMHPLREVRGIIVDSLDTQRQMLNRLYDLPAADREDP